MKGDKIRARILSIQEIPRADEALLSALSIQSGYESLGILTTDIDDISYAALDEATKKADVIVAYAHSLYGGAGNASTKLAGEFIGILAGRDPEEVKSGIRAAAEHMEQGAYFQSANEDDSIVYFAHCISRSGSFLSGLAKVPLGEPLAYLIAPPNEAICGLDRALKAARVTLRTFYGPPTETNFAGGILSGEQSACLAACAAFSDAVCEVAAQPLYNW